jgi:hypothetical protein
VRNVVHAEREADGFSESVVIFNDQNPTGWWLG